LLYLRELGPTEVSGFGIAPADDLLRIDDVCLIQQRCTPVSVAFDDEAVAAFFDEQVDQGLRPEQFGRIWIHTHPGTCAAPSWVDEETFTRVFGRADWAVMFILARGGATYARLRFNTGPGADAEIATQVDYSRTFAASAEQLWADEYLSSVMEQPLGSAGDMHDESLDDVLFAEFLDISERSSNESGRSLFATG
jgi:proteasome lid subunit RPN8/RPN11